MWQMLAGAGLGAVGSLVGGIMGRGQAKRIGTIEQQFYEDQERRARELSGELNPYIQSAYEQAQEGIRGTAFPQADLLQQRGEQAGADVMAATREGIGYLDPYMQAGQRAVTGLETLAGAKAPTAADLEFDPGYQFRLSEGQRALERSAAARGGLQGGGTLRALTRYSQGEASQEYANAFDRFMRQQEGRRSTLAGLAGYGAQAGATAAGNLLKGGESAAQFGYGGLRDAAGMRVKANEQIGNLGVESTLKRSGLIADDVAFQRAARERALQARTGSMTAASNAFNQGLSGAIGAGAQGLTLWGLSKQAQQNGGDGGVSDYGWGDTYNWETPGAVDRAIGTGRRY